MPASGRSMYMEKSGSKVAGIRNLSYNYSFEGIDISSADDNGRRKFLSGEAGNETLDFNLEGISKDAIFRAIALNPAVSKMLTDITVFLEEGDSVTGDFLFGNFSETGSYNEAITFTGTLQSSGDWTYTPAP